MKNYSKLLVICIVFVFFNIIYIPHAISATYYMTASPDPLYEDSLDGATIQLVISGTDFRQGGGDLVPENYQLNNAPTGLTISDIVGVDVKTTNVILAFGGTDFDQDITNFSVSVLPDGTQANETITSNEITIKAKIESAASLTSSPSPLTERNLNGSTLSVSLSGDTYISNIDSSYFTLNNPPPGTSISSVTRVDDTNVDILLMFDGTDFDTDFSNFFVTVASTAITNTSANLDTNSITISSVVEPITSIATTIPYDLFENNLNGSHVILNITDDAFKTTLNTADIQLNNPPAGFSVSSIVRNSSTEAEITLGFNGTDFDVDITDFSLDVLSSGLDTAPSASSNTMTIQAVQEVEGLANYISKGTSYPTMIEMVGYNSKDRKLYINSTLHTDYDVMGKTPTFNYYIKVYDGNGDTIGNLGDIDTPLSITANAGESTVDVVNKEVQLSQDFPAGYRIVVIVKSVDIS